MQLAAGKASVEEALREGRTFSAVICANDISAIGALEALKENGISIPGEVAVTGYGDQDTAQYVDPRLTTVHQFPERMGVASVEIMLQLLQGMNVTAQCIIPPELRIRF